jgi:radical SAM superfamily enzyme YgiQ (UPF0313 family)
MKTMFVYPNVLGSRHINISIAYLSAYLKEAGHKTKLIDTTFGWKIKDIVRSINSFKPDIIGFSVLTFNFDFSSRLAGLIKESFDIPIIFGGMHPTLSPDETIQNENVDMICIGEGEQTLLELVERMESGKNIRKIQGLWIKEKGEIFRNPVRPLCTDLDKLPFPDRELFDKRHLTSFMGMPFLTARGCPFQCAYCQNHLLQKLYNYKNYVRFRNIDNVLDEMEFFKKRYNPEFLQIMDDTFTIRKDRVMEFCKKYSDRIGMPFSCFANPSTMDREMFVALKEAGCSSIGMGIEHGNDDIRINLMKRPFGRDKLIAAFSISKEVGIKTNAFNMLGLPNETRAKIFDSIRFNRLCKADTSQPSIFYPFPATELLEICMKNGYLSDRKIDNYYNDTILDLPTISRKDLIAMQKVFQMYVNTPEHLWFLPFALEKIIRYSPMSIGKFYDYFIMAIQRDKHDLVDKLLIRINEKLGI